jgi:hypothetical protein
MVLADSGMVGVSPAGTDSIPSPSVQGETAQPDELLLPLIEITPDEEDLAAETAEAERVEAERVEAERAEAERAEAER